MTTWQEVVYGGSKRPVDEAPSQPSKTFQSDATANGTAPEALSAKNEPVILISPQARLLAQSRLAQMHREGLTWYELQKRYHYPAATLQHWAAGRGRMAIEMIERLISDRLIYADITDAIPAIPCPTCGHLHQVDDCHGQDGEPVIVPAGARVVQPKPASAKPRRKRDRMEATRYTERGFTMAEIIEINREIFDNGRIPAWLWNHPGMAETIAIKQATLASMVDTWLAEDTANPGDLAAVAEVLARLEQPATPVAP